jgi:hypothetical protein
VLSVRSAIVRRLNSSQQEFALPETDNLAGNPRGEAQLSVSRFLDRNLSGTSGDFLPKSDGDGLPFLSSGDFARPNET